MLYVIHTIVHNRYTAQFTHAQLINPETEAA